MGATELTRDSNTCGFRLTTTGQTWEVTFNTDGPLGGHIRTTDYAAIDRPLTTKVQPQRGIETGESATLQVMPSKDSKHTRG